MDRLAPWLATHIDLCAFAPQRTKRCCNPAAWQEELYHCAAVQLDLIDLLLVSDTFMSATSLMTPLSVLVSSLESRLQCGSSCAKSIIR